MTYGETAGDDFLCLRNQKFI